MTTFGERVDRARQKAGLGWSELAIWFGKPKSTVWSWVNIPDRNVRWYDGDRVAQLLQRLEKDPAFPIPLNVRQGDRMGYVKRHRERLKTR